MKGRLGDAPLAEPEFALARQQAVAERHAQFVVERALVIVARVVLQDVANVGRVRDEVATPRANPEIHHIAETAGGAQEHLRRIASERRQHAEDGKPVRARWKRLCGASGVSHSTTGTISLSPNTTPFRAAVAELHEHSSRFVNALRGA